MSNSIINTKRSMSVWQFAVLITIVYAIGLFISHKATVMETVYWSGYELQVKNKSDQWTDSNRFAIGSENSIQEVRFQLTIDDSEKWQRPVGLMLGGPFSAEIFWDNEKIGDKGMVGQTQEKEVPGPIDSIFFVPSRLLKPGQHQIRVRLSTQHLLVSDASIFHSIWLAPYRESGRRDLRYYAAPLLILSALIVLSLQSFRIGHNAGNQLHTGLGLFGFSIVVALMAEISRAVINYPYQYHELRGLFSWLGNSGAGLALLYTCYRLTKGSLAKALLWFGVAVYLASHFITMSSGDMRMALDFILLALGPALVFSYLLVQKQKSYLSTLPLFWIACVISNEIATGLFLDSFQFIASLILIGGAWVWVYVDFDDEKEQQTIPDSAQYFVIRESGEENKIPVSDCIALKGEGNYTALKMADGKSLLHQDGLGAIMNTNPQGFIRVHKSYAVNLNAIDKLRSATGSKYWLEMNDEQTVPVSRYRVAELRGLLEKR